MMDLNSPDKSALEDEKSEVDVSEETPEDQRQVQFGWGDISFSVMFATIVALWGVELMRWATQYLIAPRIFNSLLDHPCEKIVSSICPMTLEGCQGKGTLCLM
jgi:hypothetical protein